MPKVSNKLPYAYGFYFGRREFVLEKGENSISEGTLEELNKNPLFRELNKSGHFVIATEPIEVKPEAAVDTVKELLSVPKAPPIKHGQKVVKK